MAWLLIAYEAVEHLEQHIDDRLTKRVGGLSDLFFGHGTGGEREIATLFRKDGA